MTVDELLARETIRDRLHLYCRGIDRADEAAIRAAYWPDAHDRHGPFEGSANAFATWAIEALGRAERSIHRITNVLFDFRSDTEALVESQFDAVQRQPGADGAIVEWQLAGRYLDRFERRGQEWRVADRLVVYDRVEGRPASATGEVERFGPRQPIGSFGPGDPLYTFLKG